MSRTWHHGMKAKERLFGLGFYPGGFPQEETPPKKRRSRSSWNWMTTPGWWIREMMTRPQRAKVRQALHRTMKGEEVMFPHPKKPFIYYW